MGHFLASFLTVAPVWGANLDKVNCVGFQRHSRASCFRILFPSGKSKRSLSQKNYLVKCSKKRFIWRQWLQFCAFSLYLVHFWVTGWRFSYLLVLRLARKNQKGMLRELWNVFLEVARRRSLERESWLWKLKWTVYWHLTFCLGNLEGKKSKRLVAKWGGCCFIGIWWSEVLQFV